MNADYSCSVILAKARIQVVADAQNPHSASAARVACWIPAFAGMTILKNLRSSA
jgi:hypothetical protein